MVLQHVKSLVVVVGAMLLFSSMGLAQRQITGTITDADNGDPLIGVNILVVGTNTGTVTDFDGNYRLSVPDDATQLQFSYTGYTTQTIDLGASNTISLQMSAGTILDEVVVIGYGTVKREDATGSIVAVGTEQFNRGSITSAQELLAGKVAGVAISTVGEPGGASVIRIRGGSSLSATNDPLIVIDGVPVANDKISGGRNPLSIINPNDIETFTVLKDASATAIYGFRASNGVILITTKKGKLGRDLNVDYNGSVAFSNVANTLDVLSADEFRSLIEERYAEGSYPRSLLGDANTDWQDVIFQTGVFQDHNIALSGGIGTMPYRVSLGYTDRDGILRTDNYNRKSAALNLNPSFLDNSLQVNLGFKGMVDKNRFADHGAIGAAVQFDPTKPVYQEDNGYGGYYTWNDQSGNFSTLAPKNPLSLLELKEDNSTVNRFIINGSVDYRFWFLPDLRANLAMAYDRSYGEGTVVVPAFAPAEFVNGGRLGEYNQEKKNQLFDFYLNYTKSVGQVDVDLMGGYSWQWFYRNNYNFAQNADGSNIIDAPNFDPAEYYLASVFGRLNLTLFDRLLLTGTIRRDGTSRFSEDNRYGIFPSAAAAYKVISNPNGRFSNLKVRVGYGVTGQQDISDNYYPYLASYVSSFDNATYQIGDQFVTTLRPEGYDANIKWEETTTINAGIDFGFFKDRITGSIDYYQRKTTDLINFIPVPAGTNLTNFINTNVGDLENRGFEFGINMIPWQNDRNSWSFGFNVALNENEITRLTATDDPTYQGVATGGISGGVGNNIQIHSVGFPANSFYVYEQVYDDAGIPIEGLYVDRNGDGQITEADKYRFENPAPDVMMGFTSNLYLGNLDFSFGARANLGNYVYNNNLSERGHYANLFNSTGYLSNIHAQYADIDMRNPQYFSDHFVQDASFLRFDHITLGYTFRNFSRHINSLRIYAVAQNPFVITNYDGIDPEIVTLDAVSAKVTSGIDNNIYPRARTFLFGVNLGL